MSVHTIIRQSVPAACLALGLSFALTSTAEAACSDPPEPDVHWDRCDKTDENLNDQILQSAELNGTNLTDAHLVRADLTGATLMDANLTDADLTGAKLIGAMLIDTVFTGANLRGADLTGAMLQTVFLYGADLSGATWIDGRVCAEGSIGQCN